MREAVFLGMAQPRLPLWTLRDVATYLEVTERTVYRLLKDNDLPGYKVGGQWRFKEDDLMQWIASTRPITHKTKS